MMLKRVLDVIVSISVLATLLPLLIVIYLVVVLSSGSPALFRQIRVGQNCQPFTIYKFRTMVLDAEILGTYMSAPGDARVTRVGRALRRTSLDELPQLFNVLKGDMSLVGPRPDVPAQRNLYTVEEWRRRHIVRPGITGLAQAELRSAATPEQRKALDLEYTKSPSVTKDIHILFRTAIQVIFRGGN